VAILTTNLSPTNEEPGTPIPATEQIEISLGDLFSILTHRRKQIVLPVVCAALLSTAVAFLIPPEYSAETVLLTPEQPQSSLTAMAQLAGGGVGGGLSGLSLLAGFGLRNPSDLYVGILESRTIADALISKFNLKQVYDDKYLKTARKHLKKNTTIKAGKNTLIHVEVWDRNPNRAAQLANAYVDELAQRNSSVALSEASQRRLFFETQLAKEKDQLTDAEIALRNTQQFTGLVVPTGQAEALIRSASQLHAEILSRQAQLAGMRTYVSDDNPRYQRVKHELAALQSELNSLEQGQHVAGTPELPLGKLPEAGLEYIRKYRDLKYHEALFEALAKQYEAARLDEAKAAPMIQILDRAVVPEKKSWPPRTIIIVTCTLLAAVISALWIILASNGAAGTKG
jgi:tyrosine-protein kinase Etk/Wzc